MRIIYKTDEGGVAIVAPSNEWTGTMKKLADWTVPTGLKYKIVDDDYAVPSDRTFRNAWEVDESELTDGVGA